MSVQKKITKKRQRTILLVEDEAGIRGALKEKLLDCEYKVIETTNGEEGFEVVMNQLMPDVIILDLIMPKMDGITMLKLCREHHPQIDNKVIVYTQLLESQTAQRVLHRTGKYMAKSEYSIDDVVASVQERFSQSV